MSAADCLNRPLRFRPETLWTAFEHEFDRWRVPELIESPAPGVDSGVTVPSRKSRSSAKLSRLIVPVRAMSVAVRWHNDGP